MKKIIPLLGFLVFSIASLQAQILLEENFENGVIPSEWTMQTMATDGGWKVGSPEELSSQSFSFAPNGSTNIAATNDNACDCDKSNEYFISPPIDLSDVTAAVLTVDIYYTDGNHQGNQEDATIEASTDGSTWKVLENLHGHDSWDKHSVGLSEYAGEDSLYIGFRYDDGAGWAFGFGIDNVVVEVPPTLEVDLVEINSPIYGEVDKDLPIKGILFNEGDTPINSLEINYTINGANSIVETIDNINIPPFSFYEFETANPWLPDAVGSYNIAILITAVNGTIDGNVNNNGGIFSTEIFDQVIVPNKIDDFLAAPPLLSVITNSTNLLNKPTDLAFFPILGRDELWVVNQRTENMGGSTLTISDATAEAPTRYKHRIDGNAWHFMSLPSGIAFSPENFNFATCPFVQDANHNGGTFTGPTLWSSHPDIYAQPSGGNGSHLDMLHGSPFSMGIAHEVDNVFWVYDNWHKDIVRYDFVEDHGPGNDDHSDAIVRRYKNIGINGDGDVPNHMILDKSSGWLYFVDNGNDRVMRLNINSGSVASPLAEINEELAEHSLMGNFDVEVIIDSGLDRPCGIEIIENKLLVGDYANGDIIVFDMDNDFQELGRIPTNEPGLTGIIIGPHGNLWYTNRIQNTLMTAWPAEFTSAVEINKSFEVNISPNPSSEMILVDIPNLESDAQTSIRLCNINGQELLTIAKANKRQELNVSHLPNGVYLVHVQGTAFFKTEKIIVSR